MEHNLIRPLFLKSPQGLQARHLVEYQLVAFSQANLLEKEGISYQGLKQFFKGNKLALQLQNKIRNRDVEEVQQYGLEIRFDNFQEWYEGTTTTLET
jgi:hypothetical protein